MNWEERRREGRRK